jgi:prepilin-type N-terminal cleavage/methylation domain-containing protein/prepilin-type processing-associated H-X9-DG protein
VARRRNGFRKGVIMFHAPQGGGGPASRRRRHRRPRRVRAFTLIELLVVVGIIAALAGILLPAVNAARHEADAIACTANVRTIGTAALMYAQQNKRYVTYLAATRTDRKQLLMPYIAQGRSNRDNEAGQVWQCPANTKVHQVDGLHLEASYGFNTNLNGVRIERVKRPSETVALCDAGLMDVPSSDPNAARATHVWPPGRPATPSSTRPNHTRHPKAAVSVGFVDGHADRMRMEPPFYPGPAGTYTPNGVTNINDPNYQDRMWDLY